MMAALGTVFLFLANVLPAGRLVLLVVASFPICVALLMYGRGWAAGVYITVAVLSNLLFPGTAAIAFAAFFGYYPVLKSIFERMHNIALVWSLKYGLYVVSFVLYAVLANTVFAADAITIPWLLLFIGGAAAFFVYDRCYTILIQFYIEKIARYFP